MPPPRFISSPWKHLQRTEPPHCWNATEKHSTAHCATSRLTIETGKVVIVGGSRQSLDALAAREGGVNTAAIDEILSAGEAVEDLLSRLRAATDVEAARAILRADGHRIGALDYALERGLAGLRPAEARLLDLVRNQIIGPAIGEALQACNWQLA